MKNLIIIISSIAVIGVGLIFGFRSLVSHIYNHVDCEQFNIDNIEVRTGIDIPAVSRVECNCNEEKTMKTSTFTLDSEKVQLEQYVLRNNFKVSNGLYENSGERADTRWNAILDLETRQLKVTIEYL